VSSHFDLDVLANHYPKRVGSLMETKNIQLANLILSSKSTVGFQGVAKELFLPS
jgi:hypothetical protein